MKLIYVFEILLYGSMMGLVWSLFNLFFAGFNN